jgi:hypothetical protein
VTAANVQLAELMEQARLSNKSLARGVREADERRGGFLRTDHTTVKRWREGVVPRGIAIACLIDVFTDKLGRPVTARELGLMSSADVRPGLGLTYETALAEVFTVLGDLVQLDVDRHTALTVDFSADAVNAFCLDWIYRADASPLPSVGRAVTARDVAELRATRTSLDSLDRAFGSGHHRDLALKYVQDVVLPKLHGSLDHDAGRDFLREAAVLCELVGWMAYDALSHSVAQRYFTQAVRLADAAGDHGYAAYALTSLAAQALWLDQPRQALRLSRIAFDRSSSVGNRLATIESLVVQGRALAALADADASGLSMARAEEEYARLDHARLPAWGSGWTSLVMASHAATCQVDLGRPEQAQAMLQPIWTAAAEQPRRRAYVAVQLGRAALLTGDTEAARGFAVAAATDQSCGATSLSAQLAARLRRQLPDERNRGHAARLVS